MLNMTYNRMTIKQKILRFLIENKEKSFSIYELSKVLKIDYKLAYINVKKLKEDLSIGVEDLKSQKRCSFKDNFNEEVYIVESKRRQDLLKKKKFRAIYDNLRIINKQFIILLFGSQVKENSTEDSDIDLILISDKDAKTIENRLEILPLNIHITPITYESFMDMAKSKELSVISEVLKKNIILFGIEDYYRLLKNAK